jgi:glycosyltransferase involved in cell wall biosynthesis
VIQNLFDPAIVSRDTRCDRSENIIVSVANGFGKLKNMHTGLQAFRLLREPRPDLKYRLIGIGMQPGGPAESYARVSGLAEGVEFLGPLPHEQVLENVRSATVFLHPSLEESFGMSILEAMLVGTPVVGGSRSGNVPSLLRNGQAGVLCNVLEPNEIKDSVLGLLRDREKALSLSRTAAEYAETNFSTDVIVSAYLDYYSEILSVQ